MLRLGDNVVSDGGAGMAALGLDGLVPLEEQLRRAVDPAEALRSEKERAALRRPSDPGSQR